MPNKIKSAKQFRLMEGAANGGDYGPSKAVAKELLASQSESSKSRFAKAKMKPTMNKMMMGKRKKLTHPLM